MVDGNIIKHIDVGEFLIIEHWTELRRFSATSIKCCTTYLAFPTVAATNMLAIRILVYFFGALNWNSCWSRDLKVMNINRSFYTKSSVQRIYLPHHHGGRGLLNLECLHDRIVLDTIYGFLRSTDSLMDFVKVHEITGTWRPFTRPPPCWRRWWRREAYGNRYVESQEDARRPLNATTH